MLRPGLTIVPDLTEDPCFSANPLVTGEPHLRFYAGAVLRTPEGLPLGALCVLDHVPGGLTGDQAFALTTLAQQVMSQLNLRRAIAERDDVLEASRKGEERQTLLVRELHHRVRNTLAMVQALVGATGSVHRQLRRVLPLVLGPDHLPGKDPQPADGGLLADGSAAGDRSQ
jgi:GAF domain-containing protein